MFGFEERMLEASNDSEGRRVVTNEKIVEELCSSLTFVDEIHAFYAQAAINEKEMIRFEGYRMESEKLPVYWEWKFTGVYVYDVELKETLLKVDIDPVLMYQYLNTLEEMVYQKLGKPQYFRNNLVRIRRASYDKRAKMHTFVDAFYEVTDENSFVSSTSIEAKEILKSEIPSYLLHEKEIAEEEARIAAVKQFEEKRLGF